jgi:hypothetical protein
LQQRLDPVVNRRQHRLRLDRALGWVLCKDLVADMDFVDGDAAMCGANSCSTNEAETTAKLHA